MTENTEIKCLQRNPLFSVDSESNPILCSLPTQGVDVTLLASTGAEVSLALFRQYRVQIFMSLIAVSLGVFVCPKVRNRAKGYPHVLQCVMDTPSSGERWTL